ncbi:hypothetical protein B7Y94_01310 [Candidatus Saccharibacteria bacterium 32-49-12]|nr:MAG: hypothetical protein B7Y94_01310 [Candidatus Saccharibacteria bacterium 32-49-12]
MTQAKIGCVKAATTILGDKWTPHIIRLLANEGDVRFCQFEEQLDGINPRTLSARLSSLENCEVIKKIPTTSRRRCRYSLTEKGSALMPILRDMDNWSQNFASASSQ